MVTGNAMGGRYLTDLHCDIDQTNFVANCACSSKGCDQASQKVACANSFSRKHLKIQEEDMNGLMVGGSPNFFLFVLYSVCKKLEMKGRTTYSEVADEIIAELAAPDVNPVPLNEFDEKNIRRRVYDALNVLMAMDIIAKDKKEIQWKGFPRKSPDDIKELEALRLGLMSRIEKKASYLHDLQEQDNGVGVERSSENESYQLIGEGDSLCAIGWARGEASSPWSIVVLVEEIQGLVRGSTCQSPFITFLRSANEEADSLACLGVTRPHIAGLQNLMLRNQRLHKSGAITAQGIGLPFILVRQTRREATVEIEISEDMQLVHFDFNGTPFSLLDEVSVLKAMRNPQDPDCGHISQNLLPSQSSSGHSNRSKSFNAIPFSWNSEFSNV
ncbi:transcription factor-like protein DPA isoform X1 [Cinnamomum micranthum f. kanehirae]|uniref:Transcription factor-like protein DPA isoform X1 n=1 Tax=Cinnamomum micranthum f. kanehirae TaxID=337451 RepID=A0A3S3MLY1_9MAGN|nr:transcription factor-like protein DPA isoform X1 [Cinnamomum micranthum f. kanehirae]